MKFHRSTKVSLKECNPEKLRILRVALLEYAVVVNRFINQFWVLEELPKKKELLKPLVNSVLPTWLSARLRKVAAREALDLILASRESAEALGKQPKKPIHRGKRMCVSSTISHLQSKKKARSFDCWLHLASIGFHHELGQIILDLPVRLHRHYHKLASLGKFQQSYIITEKWVQLCFEVKTEPKLPPTRSIGIDTGIKALASTSTGHQFGRDIEAGVTRIKRCKHGSKGQRRARRALRQRMDECALQLFDTLQPTLVVVERLRGLNQSTRLRRRLNKTMRRSLGSWAYRYWLDRVQRECEIRRSSFRSVDPRYTSQRCSICGHTERRNRSGEVFRCKRCDHTDNADLNAARNILDRFLTGPYGAGCKPLLVNGILR